ncbi:MAG: glycerol-3-phosphate 1-O-acyltransferase PlsY [Pseudomonadota bacterium]
MQDVLIKIFLAYAIGSVMGSQIAGWLKGVDIRTVGSGNAGSTNALRTQGRGFALLVLVIDVGKGALAAGWIPTLPLIAGATVPPYWLAYVCAGAAVLGHVYPLFYGFRGGKGAATLVGTLLVFDPILVLPLLGVFILTIIITGYVGLATMVTADTAPFLILAVYWLDRVPLLIYAFIMSGVIIFTHRSNIMRMIDGTESRNTRLMLLRRQ